MVNELAIEFLDMQATFAAASGPEPNVLRPNDKL